MVSLNPDVETLVRFILHITLLNIRIKYMPF